MSNLNDFLEKLGSDADLMDAYKKDPEGVMKANGLSDEEIRAVISADAKKIKALSGDKQDSKTYILVHVNKK
ncbi:hypothetical protein [Shewanella woodyi]|uniref:hypothetical protein n=1 Tax=Shewanella woodyi TaxID=60961 RepID=UPI0037488B00